MLAVCKSCLVKHLEKLSTCPTCEIVIHQSHPLNFISYDRTMQDIVNYLCPKLQEEEARREEEFYRKKKIPNPRANMIPNGNGVNHENHIVLSNNSTANSLTNGNTFSDNTLHHSNRHHPYNSTHRVKTEEEKYSKDINSYHRGDDQLNIVIESYPGCKLDPVKRKYIRCSIHTTITHIRKFVAKKLYKNFEQYKEVCKSQSRTDDHDSDRFLIYRLISFVMEGSLVKITA